MMYSIKDLSELAGYTSRVYTLISTLHRVHANAYHIRGGQSELYSLSDVQGTIQKGFDGVRFEHVPVVAPGLWPQGGEELLDSLSIIIRRGEHLLVSLSFPTQNMPLLTNNRFLDQTEWVKVPFPESSQVSGQFTEDW